MFAFLPLQERCGKTWRYAVWEILQMVMGSNWCRSFMGFTVYGPLIRLLCWHFMTATFFFPEPGRIARIAIKPQAAIRGRCWTICLTLHSHSMVKQGYCVTPCVHSFFEFHLSTTIPKDLPVGQSFPRLPPVVKTDRLRSTSWMPLGCNSTLYVILLVPWSASNPQEMLTWKL